MSTSKSKITPTKALLVVSLIASALGVCAGPAVAGYDLQVRKLIAAARALSYCEWQTPTQCYGETLRVVSIIRGLDAMDPAR